MDGRTILRALEDEHIPPEDALTKLERAAHEAPTTDMRMDACRALGALAGRAHGASWEVAERAAFVLLSIAREADAPPERVRLLHAMGLGFRNVWLMPYVHSRISDDDETVVEAAITAAGGLAFPALEEAIAGFLGDEGNRTLRLAAIGALGRMGAQSAAIRIAELVPSEPCAALAALTEIRSNTGEASALAVLSRDPPHDVVVAAVRYLAEIGNPGVSKTLRKLVRHEGADLRIIASLVSRALEAERKRDAGERILAALTETDRAARSALARRLRTIPVADVLEQAEVLLSDDAQGVIQIVAEVRAPEVTGFLVRVAKDESVDVQVRARAAGSIEANETWERDALVDLAGSKEPAVRVAATQTIGAFATLGVLLDRLGHLIEDPEPSVRGALLWALQLAARPRKLDGADRTRTEAIVRKALGDPDPSVRRRAAYVAGNLDCRALVPDLVELARKETERADLRVAAFVGLGEIGAPARFADLVHLWNQEDDPEALDAVSRAMEKSVEPVTEGPPSAPASLARVHDRLKKLLGAADARVRAAAARVSSLGTNVPAEPLVELSRDPSPRVREQAVMALGRIGGQEAALAKALADADPAVQERAAEALLAQKTSTATLRVIDFVSRTADRAAAFRLARRIEAPSADGVFEALGAALGRISHDDPIYELLLELKVLALEATRPVSSSATSVDAAIVSVFPTWTKLSSVRGFEPLGRSLRTAEMLQGAAGVDADMSAPIILWMKCLEGYMHAWLGPRLRAMQEQPAQLWELTDRLLGTSWPAYQRWLQERWPESVKVGTLDVELPLRSVVNSMREYQERRLKQLDSPISVTDWSRMMLFLAVDHPSGPKNVLKVSITNADRAVKLAHKLQVLAQVRNIVTHRSVAGASTLAEFRKSYYSAFEELTAMA
jgi:HEAT repeat protein